MVTVLAVLTGTLTSTALTVATAFMAVAGLIGIWLFDRRDAWSWKSDAADYLTIVGMIGLWGELVDGDWGWLLGVPFYWGLGTIIRRWKHDR